MDILLTRPSLASTRAYREATTLSGVKTVTVTHNWGVPPLVYFVPSNTAQPSVILNVIHAADFLSFVYTTGQSLTGKLYII